MSRTVYGEEYALAAEVPVRHPHPPDVQEAIDAAAEQMATLYCAAYGARMCPGQCATQQVLAELGVNQREACPCRCRLEEPTNALRDELRRVADRLAVTRFRSTCGCYTGEAAATVGKGGRATWADIQAYREKHDASRTRRCSVCGHRIGRMSRTGMCRRHAKEDRLSKAVLAG